MNEKASVNRSRSSQAVWSWEARRETVKTVDRRKLLISLCVGLAVAVILFAFGKRHMAAVVAGISAFIFLCGLAAPSVYFAIERGFQIFAVGVGKALSWILLTPLFYLFFTPARLIQAVAGKDPLHRKFPGGLESYWHPRPEIKDPDRYYTRQF